MPSHAWKRGWSLHYRRRHRMASRQQDGSRRIISHCSTPNWNTATEILEARQHGNHVLIKSSLSVVISPTLKTNLFASWMATFKYHLPKCMKLNHLQNKIDCRKFWNRFKSAWTWNIQLLFFTICPRYPAMWEFATIRYPQKQLSFQAIPSTPGLRLRQTPQLTLWRAKQGHPCNWGTWQQFEEVGFLSSAHQLCKLNL